MEVKWQPEFSSFGLFSEFILYSGRICVLFDPSKALFALRHELIAVGDFELMWPSNSGILMKADILCC